MATTIDQLILQANKGDGQACFDLYQEFKNGIHVKEDQETAQEWLDKAIDFNHPAARLILDMDLLSTGHIDEAVDSLEEECSKDNPEALNVLGQLYLGNIDKVSEDIIDLSKGIELLTKAAWLGSLSAQILLGKCYYIGKWVSKDIFLARYWLQKASEQSEEAMQLYDEACREITLPN